MSNVTINTNPLLCDPETGVCEIPGFNNEEVSVSSVQSKDKPVKVIYFTDPICSSCWGIEPQLRKLKLEYGSSIDVEYRMGGLLPNWNYSGGGINGPSDVARHWDEASAYYDMPIDGDVWLEDPLNSSYPPSIAFKAAQLQDEEKAILFLRKIREMVFLQKKNIAKWEHIASAAENAGLNIEKLKSDFEGRAGTLFDEDMKTAREYGVRGFPTMFFEGRNDTREMVYGSRPYPFYETAVLTLAPKASKADYDADWQALFAAYRSLTAKEFAVLSGVKRSESEQILDELVLSGKLEKLTTKNGSLWMIK